MEKSYEESGLPKAIPGGEGEPKKNSKKMCLEMSSRHPAGQTILSSRRARYDQTGELRDKEKKFINGRKKESSHPNRRLQ